MLSSFISEEAQNYANKDAEAFKRSAWQIKRSYEFVHIIASRVVTENVTHRNLQEKLPRSNETAETNRDELASVLSQLSLTGLMVELDLKCFYIFAKIVLDKVAIFLQDYFGGARGIKFDSHDKLTKKHAEFFEMKGINYPPEFTENLLHLKERVCDYRDKHIEHVKELHMLEGFMQSSSGEPRLVKSISSDPTINRPSIKSNLKRPRRLWK